MSLTAADLAAARERRAKRTSGGTATTSLTPGDLDAARQRRAAKQNSDTMSPYGDIDIEAYAAANPDMREQIGRGRQAAVEKRRIKPKLTPTSARPKPKKLSDATTKMGVFMDAPLDIFTNKGGYVPPPTDAKGTFFGDLSKDPWKGSLANTLETILGNERIALTPQDVHTPTLDTVGNIGSQLIQAGVAAPRAAATLAPKLGRLTAPALGAILGTEVQMRQEGIEDPAGIGTAALQGAGAAMIPGGKWAQMIAQPGFDIITGAAEVARREPALASRLVDGTATAEDKEAAATMMAYNVLPGVVGGVGGHAAGYFHERAAGKAELARDRAIGRLAGDADVFGQRQAMGNAVAESQPPPQNPYDLAMPEPPPMLPPRLEPEGSYAPEDTFPRAPQAFDQSPPTLPPRIEDVQNFYGEGTQPGPPLELGPVPPRPRPRPELASPIAPEPLGLPNAPRLEAEPLIPPPGFREPSLAAPEAPPIPLRGLSPPELGQTTLPEGLPPAIEAAPTGKMPRGRGLSRSARRRGYARNPAILISDAVDKAIAMFKQLQAFGGGMKRGMEGLPADIRENFRQSAPIKPFRRGVQVTKPTLRDRVSGAVQTGERALDATKRALVESPNTALSSTAQIFMPNYGAGPEYAYIKAVRDGRRAYQASIRYAFEERWNDELKDATPEQIKQIEAALEDRSRDTSALTQKQLNTLEEARNLIAGLQKALADMGVTSKNMETKIRGSMGEYFRRFYRVHEDADVPRRIRRERPQVYDDAVIEWAINHGTKKHGPLSEAKARQELDDYLTGIVNETKTRGSKDAQAGSGTGLLLGPTLTRHLEDAPALRELLGEYTGPVQRFSRTHADLTEQVARGQFFKDLVGYRDKDGKIVQPALDDKGKPFVITEEQKLSGQFPEYSQLIKPTVGSIHQFGDIEGMYARPQHAAALKDMGDGGFSGPIGKLIQDTIGKGFNISNTALSTGTLGANFLSGALYHSVLSNSSIVNPANRGFYKRAMKALRDPKSADFKELMEAGAGAGLYLQEPLDTKSFIAIDKAIEEGFSPFEAVSRVLRNADRLPGVKQAAHVYNSVDLLFRFASVYKRLEQNIARGIPYDVAMKESVQWTNKFHPDYSKVPSWAKQLKQSGLLGPFLSYQLDQPRILANGIRHNPLKTAVAFGVAKAVKEGFNGLLDKDEREASRTIQPLLTDYEQSDSVIFLNFNGKLRALPMGRFYTPASVQSLVSDPSVRNFLLTSPEAQFLITALTGGDTHGRVQLPADASDLERITFAAKKLGASMIPRTARDIAGIAEGFEGKKNKYGVVKEPGFDIMGLTGMRPRTPEFDTMYRFRANDMTKGFLDRVDKLNNLAESERTTTAELEEQIFDVNTRLNDLLAKQAEIDKALDEGLRVWPKNVSVDSDKNIRAGEFILERAIDRADKALDAAFNALPPNHPLSTGKQQLPVYAPEQP